ncbi:AIPR family protein [Paenibacillus sp. SAF-068]|uniref:AIPR family protein n=1 Tax=Paenibacillus sp. SAF-068 TaxID=3436864 RepID=UPI003F80B1A8
MGLLEVRQIRERLFENYDGIIDLGDTKSGKTEELEKNFLSRALAAYSVNILYPTVEVGEIVKYIVDGPNDNGIDVIFYNRDLEELCLTQSKFNEKGDSEPDLGEIKKFVSGVRDLINMKFDKFNEKVNLLKDEVVEALRKSRLKLKIVLIYTATNLSAHARQEFNELLEELNTIREVAELEIINQKRVHSSLSNATSKRNIEVEVQLKQWGHYHGGKEAFYGQISGDQLAEWWESYGNDLYEYNLRRVLGTTDINNEMRETLETEPELFWFYNNGVTLVCEEVIKKPIFGNSRDLGIFDCRGISIVNGAQTVGVIGKYGQSSESNKTNLQNVYVPFRIVSMQTVDDEGNNYQDENFASDVTSKNNRQNRIENRDFVVLDPIQKRIENVLGISGITYHLMRSEDEEVSSENSFSLREATRALSFAQDIEATILVSREIGTVYSDLNHARYKRLFNESTTGYYVWNCVLIQRIINEAINTVMDEEGDTDKAILLHGHELISKVIFDLLTVRNINKNDIGIDYLIEGKDFINLVKSILSVIPESVVNTKKGLANFFKSPSDMRNLYFTIIGSIGIIESGVDGAEESSRKIEFDISQIEAFTRIERAGLTRFNNKINSEDEFAKEFFENWVTTIYNPEKHHFTYNSNIQFYLKDDGVQAADRFLFRIAYYTKLIVSFEFNVYGTLYKSKLFKYPEFTEWAENNIDNKGRIIINNEEALNKILYIAQKYVN